MLVIRYARITAGPALAIAEDEPTNKPAPITPPILIIVIWRFESPSPNFFVLSLFIFHSLKIYPSKRSITFQNPTVMKKGKTAVFPNNKN